MNPPPTLSRIVRPLLRISAETLAEARAARERIAAQEKIQREADRSAEQHSEARTFKRQHTNPHE